MGGMPQAAFKDITLTLTTTELAERDYATGLVYPNKA
jgi:hypothetical protein